MIRKSLLVMLLLSAFSFALLAEGAVKGKVTDASSGEPLIGANIVLEGTTLGAATDVNGNYVISNVPDGSYTAVISYIGYTEGIFDVTVAGGDATLDATLSASGIGLNAVTISASRRPEKTLDAPASVSVIDAREVQNNSGMSSVDALRNTTGVDVSTTGVDRRELVLRGFNNAFSGAAYVLTDYRQASVPALAVNVHSIMPNVAIDVEKVEVVRGPGSALYGPGVDAGVIHYITKNPFDHPGTTASVSIGERSAYLYSFRHAGRVIDQLAYKVTGQYGEADDWEFDPNDSEDALQLAGDARARRSDYEKRNINGMLQFRPSDAITITANGGYSELRSTVLSGIGTLQADGFGYTYGQVRLQAGGFFAQAYTNRNDAGESFVYGTGTVVVDKGQQLNFQTQYDFAMADGKQQFIIGGDVDQVTPDTEGTIYGRNEDDDQIKEYGGYIQSLTRISSQLDLTVALRGDYDNIIEEISVSPRVGLVFKPNGTSAFRATYNRAFSLPGNNSLFLDIESGILDPALPLTLRGRGNRSNNSAGYGYTWNRDASYGAIANNDLVARSLNPATLGAAMPTALPLGSLYEVFYQGVSAMSNAEVAALINSQLPAPLVNEALAAALVSFLNPNGGITVGGFSNGILSNPQTGTTPTDLADVNPLQHTITQTFEAGYKGILGDKLLLALDGYYSTKENFVGPLILETPLVLVGPELNADFQSAVQTGIEGNADFVDALTGLGLSPDAVAQIITNLVAPSLPAAGTPFAAVVPVENDLGPGQLPEMLATYRSFGKVKFWGIDAALQYFASDQVTFFGNVSFVSDDFFDNEELEETNTSLSLALNAPTLKLKGGVNINVPRGASASAGVRYVKGFPVLSGDYIGDVEDYILYDFSIGYDFSKWADGFRTDFVAQNVLDNRHREFVGAPKVGRVGMIRLTYTK